MKAKLKTFAIWLILGIIFVVLLSSIIDNTNTKMTYSELISKMESGEVKEIELESDGLSAYVKIDGDNINVRLKPYIIISNFLPQIKLIVSREGFFGILFFILLLKKIKVSV